ncbi:hypothetical protein LguiB_029718 [Lonicera macranthoides]
MKLEGDFLWKIVKKFFVIQHAQEENINLSPCKNKFSTLNGYIKSKKEQNNDKPHTLQELTTLLHTLK